MRKILLITAFFLALVFNLNAQNHSLSFSFAPQLSSIHIPKPYDSFKPYISHNFNVGYSLKSNKHILNVSMQQHSNNSIMSYSTSSPDLPEGGIGNATGVYTAKGATLCLGYGFEVLTKEKFQLIPIINYGIGYYYTSGLRNPPTNVIVTPNIQTLNANYDLTTFIEKFHHRLELATKMTFSNDKKIQFFMQPSYSLAVRLKDGKKQYAFTPVYWAFGLGVGLTFNL